MTFLNPLVLFGLIASSIPLLLHLFNLRKSKPIEFSTLRFLKELQKTSIRKLKVKRIILLILRTLLITFIVLAFARPTIQSSLPVLGTHAKTSAVIIVDNSASMNVSDGRGNRLIQAKNIANSIITALKEGDEIAIVSASSLSDSNRTSLSTNFALARLDLEKLQPTNGRFNLTSAMGIASTLINESNNIGKEIYILTDAQANSIRKENTDSLMLFKKGTGVYVVPIGTFGENIGVNISVDSVRVLSSFIQKDKPVEIEATVRNSNDKPIEGVVISCLYNDKRVAQKSIDLGKNEVRKVVFSAIPDIIGVIKGTVEIENDILVADNKRYFTISIPQPPNTVIVGSSNSVVYADFALKAAEMTTGSIKRTQLILSGQSSTIDWENTQCVVLTELPTDASFLGRLQQFVEEGGGLLLFTDTKTPIQQMNLTFVQFGFSIAKELVSQKNQPLSITSFDKRHPLFSGIIKQTSTTPNLSIGEYSINKARIIDGGTPILSLTEGAILSEKHYGKGKVIACGLPALLEWSNFVQLPFFPTLVTRSVQYLSQTEFVGKNFITDEPLLLSLPKRYTIGGNFTVSDPNGVKTTCNAVQYPGGMMLPLGEAKVTGSYTVFNNENPVIGFSVNQPSDEGHLQYIPDDSFKEILENHSEKGVKVATIDETTNIARNVALARTGSELWKACLFMAIVCALAEMIVARTSRNELVSE